MGNVSDEMKTLCEDIIETHEDRKRAIKDLKQQAEIIRDNAQKFLIDCKEGHQRMSKDLRKNLTKDRKELAGDVNSLREDFRRKEKEIRSDLEEASKSWNKMSETLKARRKSLPAAGLRKGGKLR